MDVAKAIGLFHAWGIGSITETPYALQYLRMYHWIIRPTAQIKSAYWSTPKESLFQPVNPFVQNVIESLNEYTVLCANKERRFRKLYSDCHHIWAGVPSAVMEKFLTRALKGDRFRFSNFRMPNSTCCSLVFIKFWSLSQLIELRSMSWELLESKYII